METISKTFTTHYTANNIGDVQLGQANLLEITAALFTELRIMDHSVKTVGTSTPQGVFHNTIMEGLDNLGYTKILKETAELVDYIANPKFGGTTIGATLGYMAKRTKETFDFRFDLSFTELNQTLDECKMSVIIKAHRLFLAELCKKITRSYNPADIDSGKAVYRKFAGEAEQIRNGKTVMVPTFTEHSSVDFADYATLLKHVYTRMYAYSDTLGEFSKIFGAAATASKELATKLAANKRPTTLAEQRGSPKMEKKPAPQKKSTPKEHNDTTVKAGPAPTVNAWAQRQAEFELAKDLVGSEEVSDSEPETTLEPEPEKIEPEPEVEFVKVSRKKDAAKTTKTTKTTTKNPKASSRAKVLATIAP